MTTKVNYQATEINDSATKYEVVSKMDTYRKYAIVTGVLFIIATAFLFIGQAFYDPILSSANYLVNAYPSRKIVVIGILVEFVCAIAMPLIPLFTYPILKRYSEPLALGYVVFRLFETVFFVIAEISKLSLISISQGYLAGGEINSSFFQNLGSTTQSEILWTFSIYVVIFAIGSLLFNSILFKSNLVPRLISACGVMAAALILTGTVLILLELSSGITAAIYYIPIAIQEMVFALWLIFKGFNQSVIATKSAI